MTDLEKARREAHEACPCRDKFGTESCVRPGYCKCVQPIRPQSGNKTWHLCLWKSHTLIDRLCKLERLAALEEAHKKYISKKRCLCGGALNLTCILGEQVDKARRAVEES